MAHMANTVIALVGAFGFFLVFSCITSALVVKLEFRPRTPLSEIDRIDPSRRGQMERVTLLEGRPLLDRLLTPFLTDSGRTLASLTGRALENEEDRLRRAGFPYKTVGDYYAAKVLGMIALFVLGAIFIAVVLQSPQMAFVPMVLGLVGLFLPDWQIRQETKKRASTLQMEMAFTLDRIGLAMAATRLADSPGDEEEGLDPPDGDGLHPGPDWAGHGGWECPAGGAARDRQLRGWAVHQRTESGVYSNRPGDALR